MTIAVRQPITNELMGSLEKIINSGIKPDALSLKRLSRDADALCNSHPAMGSIAKAAVAAITWNIPEVRYWSENALRLERSVLNLQNACTNFLAVNEVEGIAEWIDECLERAPRDPHVVNRAISNFINVGKFHRANAVFEEAMAAGVEVSAECKQLLELQSDLRELHIPMERVEAEMHAAFKVLQANKCRSSDLNHMKFTDPDGEKSFVITINFFGDFEDELSLESQLAEAFEADAEWNPLLLSTEFKHQQAHGDPS